MSTGGPVSLAAAPVDDELALPLPEARPAALTVSEAEAEAEDWLDAGAPDALELDALELDTLVLERPLPDEVGTTVVEPAAPLPLNFSTPAVTRTG